MRVTEGTFWKCICRGDIGTEFEGIYKLVEVLQVRDIEGSNEQQCYVHFIDYNKRLEDWYSSSALLPPDPGTELPQPTARKKEEIQTRDIENLVISSYKIPTWYFSPFPQEFRKNTVYCCEFCMSFFATEAAYVRHVRNPEKCYGPKKGKSFKPPPGDEIYRDENIVLFEIDGFKHQYYCRNISLIARMFLYHKTLFADVDHFIFYVMFARVGKMLREKKIHQREIDHENEILERQQYRGRSQDSFGYYNNGSSSNSRDLMDIMGKNQRELGLSAGSRRELANNNNACLRSFSIVNENENEEQAVINRQKGEMADSYDMNRKQYQEEHGNADGFRADSFLEEMPDGVPKQTLEDDSFHLIGYFSKERMLTNILSCILTIPCYQNLGFGKLLIDAAYLLSARENRLGSPEKPLSDLGFVTFHSYWKRKIIEYLFRVSEKGTFVSGDVITVDDISRNTLIKYIDVVAVLTELQLLRETINKDKVLYIKPEYLKVYLKNSLQKDEYNNAHIMSERYLHWYPIRCMQYQYDFEYVEEHCINKKPQE